MNTTKPSKAAVEILAARGFLYNPNSQELIPEFLNAIATIIDTSMAPLREAAEEVMELTEKFYNASTDDGIGTCDEWNALFAEYEQRMPVLRTALSGSGVVTPKNDGLREESPRSRSTQEGGMK